MKIERGGKHNHAFISDSAVTITQVKLGCIQSSKGAVGEKNADGFEHVSNAAVVSACVHEACATHRAWDAARKLQSRKVQLTGHLGRLFESNACLTGHLGIVDAYAGESVGNSNDHTTITCIGNKQVRTVAKNKIRSFCGFDRKENLFNLIGVIRDDIEIRGSTHFKGGVLAHWLVYQDVLFSNNRAKLSGQAL